MTRRFDFDAIVPRRGSGSYKWDAHDDPDDTIEMWVADMDFRTAPAVIDALRRRVEHGVFGYTQVPDAYYEALDRWFDRRHGFHVRRADVIYVPGVVPAISAIIKALCREGDGVIVQTPAYNCFYSSIRNNGCRLAANPLRRRDTPDGRITFDIDFDGLETLAADPSNTLLLLCNPHNPTGRVWTDDELRRVSDICRRHGVTIVSDEIHCELTAPGTSYRPMTLVDPDAIICCSPSKAFNTAGLQIANIIAPVAERRALIDRAVNINEVCDVNPFGVAGLIAAYDEGEEWLDALRDYLAENYRLLCRVFSERLPEIKFTKLEATYLVWADIAATCLDGDSLEKLLVDKSRVRVNSGSVYGDPSYIRINIACPRAVLAEALERITPALRTLIDRAN